MGMSAYHDVGIAAEVVLHRAFDRPVRHLYGIEDFMHHPPQSSHDTARPGLPAAGGLQARPGDRPSHCPHCRAGRKAWSSSLKAASRQATAVRGSVLPDEACAGSDGRCSSHSQHGEPITHDEENVAHGAHRSAILPNRRFLGDKELEEQSARQPWRFTDNPTVLDVQCQRSARVGFPWRVPQDYHLGVQPLRR
jgi:hypothetical protein